MILQYFFKTKLTNKVWIVLFFINCNTIYGQNITGLIKNKTNNQPIEFANIGIVDKNIGTVSDLNGRFSFFVDQKYNNDTVQISFIGYKPLVIKVSDLRGVDEHILFLEEKSYQLDEIIIKPKKFKQKTLGVTAKAKGMAAGFNNNLLGYECGILMKVKKIAFIKTININIASCSYDTIFYRLNIYKVTEKMKFTNILREPIYITLPKKSVKDEISINVESRNIVVDGNFLVTLEHVKDLKGGHMYFCAGLGNKTYYRKTSQGKWESVPIGVSISVNANVEK